MAFDVHGGYPAHHLVTAAGRCRAAPLPHAYDLIEVLVATATKTSIKSPARKRISDIRDIRSGGFRFVPG
jgi:hypothetical protein